jgi:hypothetical protein
MLACRTNTHTEAASRVLAPGSKPPPDGTLVKALERAWRWQRMLDDGVYTSVSEIGGCQEYLEELCEMR